MAFKPRELVYMRVKGSAYVYKFLHMYETEDEREHDY